MPICGSMSPSHAARWHWRAWPSRRPRIARCRRRQEASVSPFRFPPEILVDNSPSTYRTLAELVDAARAKPAELSLASVGPNATQHIGNERFKRLARAHLTYVPYPGGALTVNALLGAHVTAAVLNW